MKKFPWLLGIGVVLVGSPLIYTLARPTKVATKPKTTVQATKSRAPRSATPKRVKHTPQLADFSPAKVLAAKIWVHEKGTKVLADGLKLHVRTLYAGERVKPNSPKSAVYPHDMQQIYSDNTQNLKYYFNTITYTPNADQTVTIAQHVPATWEPKAQDPKGYDNIVTQDTEGMIKPKRTIDPSNADHADVLKIVQAIS